MDDCQGRQRKGNTVLAIYMLGGMATFQKSQHLACEGEWTYVYIYAKQKHLGCKKW